MYWFYYVNAVQAFAADGAEVLYIKDFLSLLTLSTLCPKQ